MHKKTASSLIQIYQYYNFLALCALLSSSRFTLRVMDGHVSLLVFFVVCSRILPFVKKMIIYEDKTNILTNYKPARNGENKKFRSLY